MPRLPSTPCLCLRCTIKPERACNLAYATCACSRCRAVRPRRRRSATPSCVPPSLLATFCVPVSLPSCSWPQSAQNSARSWPAASSQPGPASGAQRQHSVTVGSNGGRGRAGDRRRGRCEPDQPQHPADHQDGPDAEWAQARRLWALQVGRQDGRQATPAPGEPAIGRTLRRSSRAAARALHQGLTGPPPQPPPRVFCARRLRSLYKALKFLHGKGRYQKKKIEVAMITESRCALTAPAHKRRNRCQPPALACVPAPCPVPALCTFSTPPAPRPPPRWLLIPLTCAERAWAQAMEIKKDNEDRKLPHRRHHSIRRLAKAAAWASELARFTAGARRARMCCSVP